MFLIPQTRKNSFLTPIIIYSLFLYVPSIPIILSKKLDIHWMILKWNTRPIKPTDGTVNRSILAIFTSKELENSEVFSPLFTIRTPSYLLSRPRILYQSLPNTLLIYVRGYSTGYSTHL